MSWLVTAQELSCVPKPRVKIAAEMLYDSCSIPRATLPHSYWVPVFKDVLKKAAEVADELNLGVKPRGSRRTEVVPRSKDRVAAAIEYSCIAYIHSSIGIPGL